ncbi:hypothetical protein CANTEDRAFT_129595 [Yamadazyma tenuis ATCC 10573]|uniref:Uncharacterized protein n=1 Tax=Candida tenuis (strain ATCC 10573 / BCRC 21748 / CBS 615 / JCM 9827 / NBRC 10315 / NRRL Y-1498 / VKM Y-70) TaxID=590646 RepID=G3B053_CANTC|nr:uncharacterized protein CANTEDRAFT_129595 [Yamadazyma tenuis ATCC 10573]EGV65320.1 hypothetical protein CANTEDRAFT_129595 [Yamadazyma tenuis ATCC 10573]
MSRREEIKKKELLQLQFQQQLQHNTTMIQSWLPSSSQKMAPKPRQQFFDLPIIESGKSLNSIAEANETQRLGEFLDADSHKAFSRNKANGPPSGAMNTLMNKIKSDRRKKTETIRTPIGKNRVKPLAPIVNVGGTASASDSDSDADLRSDNRPTTKKPKLLF